MKKDEGQEKRREKEKEKEKAEPFFTFVLKMKVVALLLSLLVLGVLAAPEYQRITDLPGIVCALAQRSRCPLKLVI